MRKAALILSVLIVIGAVVLWQAPATLVGSRVAKLSDGRLVLADAGGTIWRGSGIVSLGDARIPVAWQLHPTALVRRQVGVTLTPLGEGTGARANVILGEGTARVQDLDLTLPAAAIIPLLLPRPRLAAGGDIQFRAADFAWGAAGGAGAVAIDWRRATLGLAGGAPVGLGDVSAALTAIDGRLTGPVRNTGGEFALDGVLTVLPNGGGEIRAVVRPRDPADHRLDPLGTAAGPDGSGVALDWRWPGR